MKTGVHIVIMVMLALLISATSYAGTKQMEWVKIGKDGRPFVLASSGKAFAPRGFNYDRDYNMRLLEDYWETEWSTVQEDFGEMKAMGANVVRIHLQFGRFMHSPDKADEKALDRLERLVSLAESLNLYLDITGLACYKKEHIPNWYDGLSEKERWRVQAVFWEAIAARCADHPGVFCYDIMNEPIVPSGQRKPRDWLTGELGGFYYIQFISLDQQDRVRTDIARDWLKTMTAAIRKHDKRHLVTVGMLPWTADNPALASGFEPKTVVPEVDYISVHIYPESAKMQASLDTLKEFSVGKPVVIEEIFPMHCSATELREFLTKSEEYSAGWIGFYWGKTPEQCRESGSMADAFMLGWLELFQEMTKESR